MFAKINNTKIFFDIDGMGYVPKDGVLQKKPVCFVLHGGPGESHGYFKPFLNDLTNVMQLVYIDHRGSGFSQRGHKSDYTMEKNVEDIEELRKYLGLDKIWVLGHSYGGMIAQSYAIKYQKNLEGMILAATSPSYRFLEKSKRFIEKKGTEKQKQMAKILYNGHFTSNAQVDEYYNVMEDLYVNPYGENKTDITNMEFLTELDRSYEALNEGFGGFLRTFDFTKQLKEIKIPSLVIAGKYDWITPIDENKIIAEEIPDSKFIIMENSSHNVMEEEMEKFNEAIIQFVKKNK